MTLRGVAELSKAFNEQFGDAFAGVTWENVFGNFSMSVANGIMQGALAAGDQVYYKMGADRIFTANNETITEHSGLNTDAASLRETVLAYNPKVDVGQMTVKTAAAPLDSPGRAMEVSLRRAAGLETVQSMPKGDAKGSPEEKVQAETFEAASALASRVGWATFELSNASLGYRATAGVGMDKPGRIGTEDVGAFSDATGVYTIAAPGADARRSDNLVYMRQTVNKDGGASYGFGIRASDGTIAHVSLDNPAFADFGSMDKAIASSGLSFSRGTTHEQLAAGFADFIAGSLGAKGFGLQIMGSDGKVADSLNVERKTDAKSGKTDTKVTGSSYAHAQDGSAVVATTKYNQGKDESGNATLKAQGDTHKVTAAFQGMASMSGMSATEFSNKLASTGALSMKGLMQAALLDTAGNTRFSAEMGGNLQWVIDGNKVISVAIGKGGQRHDGTASLGAGNKIENPSDGFGYAAKTATSS